MMTVVSSCVGSSTLIVGDVTEPVQADQVEILYSDPDCDFDVVAWIQIPGEYFSAESLIYAMRKEAAKLGATLLQINSVQMSGSTTYRGAARALSCNA